MSRRHFPPKLPAAIALGAALAIPGSTPAQQTDPNQTSMSTGSGAGTSPAPLSTSTNRQSVSPYGGQRGGSDPVVLPNALPTDPALIESFEKRLLPLARQITDPDSRALAMERTARAFILLPGNHFTEAHSALAEGSDAARLLPQGIVRDLRFRQLGLSYILLAEEESRDAISPDNPSDRVDPATYHYREFKDRADRLSKAGDAWQGAIDCAREIISANYRSDLVYRVCDSEAGANGSQAVVNGALQAGEPRRDLAGMRDDLKKLADQLLVRAHDHTKDINIVIWRDRALLSIAVSAAASDQFSRGFQIAQAIPQPEFRSDALIRLAESQARRNLAEDATKIYAEAARAVAAIPLEDPRAILASVLIDSLISVGRFDDARSSVAFYPDDLRKLTALGAIAMSQGERDLSSSAFKWIDNEAPPQTREFLHRKVTDGMLSAIEKQLNRGQTLIGPYDRPPANRGNP